MYSTPKILPCPHYTLPMQPDHTTRFIALIDTPDEKITLALCAICQNIIKGYFVKEIAAELAANSPLVYFKDGNYYLGITKATSDET